MVKVGFLVEGGCERIVLKSVAFQRYLTNNQIEPVGDIIDMNGKGNLTVSSRRMQSQVQALRDQGAEWIVVLRDMDNATSFATVKAEVYEAVDVATCIAVQELEAWFVADSGTLSVLFNALFHYDGPELIAKPATFLDDQRMQHTGRGIRDKKGFATAMVNNGFTIERAAKHPNCPSARYFLNKLQTLASAN